MSFTIRPYRPADLEGLYQIDQLCYTPQFAYSRAELLWYLQLPHADCLVAEFPLTAATDQTKTAGFILCASRKAHGHIITIDVLEPHRRLGVGTALLKKAESRLLRRGASEVWLETATNNNAAIAFWQRHGYRTLGVLKDYYPGALDAFAMRKVLRGPAAKEKA